LSTPIHLGQLCAPARPPAPAAPPHPFAPAPAAAASPRVGSRSAAATRRRSQLYKKVSAASLEGSGAGRGTVSVPWAGTEQVRLQGTLQSGGRAKLSGNATCATASGKAAQTATVRQVGNNRYSGSFYNSEYSISGVIDHCRAWSSQTVRLIRTWDPGVLNLSR
jgi:hypothetical protein